MDGLILSALFIFAAELGDKSQLLAIALAGRYSAGPVLVGVTLATAANHALSIFIGRLVGDTLPPHALALVVGIAFIAFGVWTLRGDRVDEATHQRRGAAVIVIAFVTFFVAELGDKTMLATITLAAQYSPLATWLGSTTGMVAADAVAILAGSLLTGFVSLSKLQTGAAVLFFAYGGREVFSGLSRVISLPLHEWVQLGIISVLAIAVGWLMLIVLRLTRRLAELESDQG